MNNTNETFPQDKKHKKILLFSSKEFIKYILATFVLLCLILLLFNLTQNKNILNNSEFNSNPKKFQLPLDKNEFKIKNEPKIFENKINLDCSLKGTNVTNGNQYIILITIIIKINNRCPTDNCFDCYINQEKQNINYPELSNKEVFISYLKN